MNVKRYFAKTAREALRMLKDDLGPDAVVLSNRAANGGVEILALPSGDVATLQTAQRARTQAQQAQASAPARPTVATRETAAPAVAPPVRPKTAADFFDEDFQLSLSRAALQRQASGSPPVPQKPLPARPADMQPFNPPRAELNRDVFHAAAAQVRRPPAEPPRSPLRNEAPVAAPSARQRPAGVEEEARIRALESANSQMASELASIRELIERQLAGFAWGEMGRTAPGRARLIGDLLEAGFSAVLARELAGHVPEDEAPEDAHRLLHGALKERFRTMASDADIIDRGGVFALVGPTGVGKTTTTAKLAARCVVRHGADKLALITTDSYRIGAHEQLRIYGRILGVPVYVVRDATDLRETLASLRDKHMVLIDTMGMSQRDKMVAEQAAMLTGAGKVSRLLLLNATSRGDTLDDVIRAYSGDGLAGVVLSKMDEAMSLAPVLDVAIRHQVDVFYVADGQRVPEDLHLPDRNGLIDQALRELPPGSPFRLEPLEAGLLMAASAKPTAAMLQGGA
ncbi:flagellar biosynthesis protein FlhF [Zoogloea sp.]|uniref:flagellar biosynthesis protein FlhF n=1 Tax=Zoogloea sp. TaxID=49181 RepID=UPI002609F29E|nr:flagellar biosynthesis protein FlhF [Zoogloea sp.]MDD3352770.1 flagellar biosynthesis protein FlhF [Zoogloea sp.]